MLGTAFRARGIHKPASGESRRLSKASHTPARAKRGSGGTVVVHAERRPRGYAIGERSSRRPERRRVEDVATRVICANHAPDHTTIARFRQRHECALAELFGEILELCAEADLVESG
jgi:Transposase domain (DUF772)